jgi:hypothetical protein
MDVGPPHSKRWGGFEIRRKPGNLDDLPLISRKMAYGSPAFLYSAHMTTGLIVNYAVGKDKS